MTMKTVFAKPEDFVPTLTEEPIISIADIDFAMKHTPGWKRQIELLARKRAAERLATLTNDLANCAADIAECQQ